MQLGEVSIERKREEAANGLLSFVFSGFHNRSHIPLCGLWKICGFVRVKNLIKVLPVRKARRFPVPGPRLIRFVLMEIRLASEKHPTTAINSGQIALNKDLSTVSAVSHLASTAQTRIKYPRPPSNESRKSDSLGLRSTPRPPSARQETPPAEYPPCRSASSASCLPSASPAACACG